MITLQPLSEARVLLVGGGDLVNGICHSLKSSGVKNITLLATADGFIKNDPERLLQTDPDYFKSFDLVLSANQPRPFEVALSGLRWPGT